MKYSGPQLIEILTRQPETVCLTDSDGRTHANLSPRYVAGLIGAGDWTGYGKHGYIERVRPAGLHLEPFATKHDVKRTMASFPRTKPVEKNRQAPGGKVWAPQPANSRTGSFGVQTTLFFRP